MSKKHRNNKYHNNDNNYKNENSSNNKDSNDTEKDIDKKEFDNRYKRQNDSFKTSSINTNEINDLIDEDLGKKNINVKKNRHVFVNLFLILLLIISIGYFIITVIDSNTSILNIVSSLIITLFSVCFCIMGISYKRKKKGLVFLGGLLLLSYLGINILNNMGNVQIVDTLKRQDFRGKSLADVIEWANKNNIVVNQDYEYSDMVPEYNIISQEEVDKNTINVAVSEGPSPYKEVVIPNMLDWDSERVISYVEDNYLSNVVVDFSESDEDKDTVIEQSTSGTIKRNDELKLTFSKGEGNEESTKLINFKNKSKFRIEFYLKQHGLDYEIKDDFSSSIKKGFGIRQSIEAGKTVTSDDKIVVTISKGPKIKVPDVKNMSLEDITKWAIKNHVKLELVQSYDDSIEKGKIISSDKKKGDVIEQASTIKITISRGKLKMKEFKSYDEFKTWADKNNINYTEEHEFSDKVAEGEVISYSYKTGDTIKNGDSIVVTISDGKKISVPDLDGLTKKEASNKLDKLNLKYNFIYKKSTKDKDIVIGQSIKAGSDVASNITITITLSNGKKEEKSTVNRRESNTSSYTRKSSNNNSSNNTNGSSNSGSNSTPTCNECSIRSGELKNIIRNNTGSFDGAKSSVISFIKGECPGITVNVIGDTTSGVEPGSFITGWEGGKTTSCSTISITLAK